MKKQDIIQLVKESIKETRAFYGSHDNFQPTGQRRNLSGMPGVMEDKKPNLKSIADVDRSGWTPDGGGGSIGYMEWEDGTEMTPQEIQDYFEANHELYDDIMQGLYETNDPEDDEEQAEYDKGWYGESLKEAASKLGYLNEEKNCGCGKNPCETYGTINEEENYQNLPKPDKINLSYTDPGFRFYGMYLYKDGKRFAKISYEDRATKYLKNLGVNTEIPRRFDTDILDKIEQEIEALGIKGDYDAAMDVS